jgi:hypothetical protein
VRKVPLLRATWYIKIVQLNNNRQKAANKVLGPIPYLFIDLLFIYLFTLFASFPYYLFIYFC